MEGCADGWSRSDVRAPSKIIRKTFSSGERGREPSHNQNFAYNAAFALHVARDLQDHFDAVWLAINFLRDYLSHHQQILPCLPYIHTMDAINSYLADKSYIQGYSPRLP